MEISAFKGCSMTFESPILTEDMIAYFGDIMVDFILAIYEDYIKLRVFYFQEQNYWFFTFRMRYRLILVWWQIQQSNWGDRRRKYDFIHLVVWRLFILFILSILGLFYHVTEDDNVAMAILKAINEQELRGEVNFFPLNRLPHKALREVNDKVG